MVETVYPGGGGINAAQSSKIADAYAPKTPQVDHPGYGDNFIRPSAASIGGTGWSGGGGYNIASNTLTPASSTDLNNPVYRSTDPTALHEGAEFVVAFAAASPVYAGLVLRHQKDASHNHYAGYAYLTGNNITLNAYALGGTNQAAPPVTGSAVVAGQKIRLRFVAANETTSGSDLWLRAYDDATGTLLAQQVWRNGYAATQTAGATGINMFNAGATNQANITGFKDIFPAPSINVVGLGDSILAGLQASAGYFVDSARASAFGTHLMGQATDSLGFDYSQVNLGYPGITAAQILAGWSANSIAAASTRLASFKRTGMKNVLFLQPGTNDIVSGAAAATVYASLQSIAAAAVTAGYDAVVCATILPRADGTSATESQRLALNALIRADLTSWNAVADLGRVPRLGEPGDCFIQSIYPDGVHPSDAGYALAVNAYVSALKGLRL